MAEGHVARGMHAYGITRGEACAFTDGLWEHRGTSWAPLASAEAATHWSGSKALKRHRGLVPVYLRQERAGASPALPPELLPGTGHQDAGGCRAAGCAAPRFGEAQGEKGGGGCGRPAGD